MLLLIPNSFCPACFQLINKSLSTNLGMCWMRKTHDLTVITPLQPQEPRTCTGMLFSPKELGCREFAHRGDKRSSVYIAIPGTRNPVCAAWCPMIPQGSNWVIADVVFQASLAWGLTHLGEREIVDDRTQEAERRESELRR